MLVKKKDVGHQIEHPEELTDKMGEQFDKMEERIEHLDKHKKD